MKNKTLAALAVIGIGAGCAQMAARDDSAEYSAKALAVMKTSFKENGQAKLDRLEQDDMQRLCSQYADKPMPKEIAQKLEQDQQKLIKYPADGKLLGDWKLGERI